MPIDNVECFAFPGGDKMIDVIDVARQADSKIKLHNYIKYFTNPDRPKVLNVISLEFSDTKWVYGFCTVVYKFCNNRKLLIHANKCSNIIVWLLTDLH